MIHISSEKRKLFLLTGFIGAALFAAGDILLHNFGNEGGTILYMIKPSIVNQPMRQLYFTLISGMFAAPMTWLGLCAADSYLTENKNTAGTKMYRCFKIAAMICTMTFFCAHSVCAVLMMSAKTSLEAGLSPETVNSAFSAPFLLSFGLTNIWVTVSEVMLSVSFIYFILTNKMNVPKIMCVMNTAGAYIVFHAVGSILTALTSNTVFDLLAGAGASLGIGFIFITVMTAERK